jgi:TorA maturation chaperone TorD
MEEHRLIYQARQSVYALLQRLYQDAPDTALLEWLAIERPFADFPVMLENDTVDALQQVDTDLQTTSVETLKRDFLRLYVGPGPMRAPPWESVYRNQEHLLFDKHTLQVRETYARHGMEFVNKNELPEDSIAIELEFMNLLTQRLLKTIEMEDSKAEQTLLEEQQRFLRQHMLVWVPRFVDLSQKHAETVFYRALAGVLIGFLRWEKETVALLLNRVSEIGETCGTPA